MRVEKKQINKRIFGVLKESSNKEDVKKKYILELFKDYFGTRTLTVKENQAFRNIINLLAKQQKELLQITPITIFYNAIEAFTRVEKLQTNEIFYNKIILKIFNVFFMNKAHNINSFIFLKTFFDIGKESVLNLDYGNMVRIINNVAAAIDTEPKEGAKKEEEIFASLFFNVLINLYQNKPLSTQTVILNRARDMSQQEREHLAPIIKEAVSPCLNSIENILNCCWNNFYNLTLLLNERNERFEKEILKLASQLNQLPYEAYEYLKNVVRTRLPELEEIVIQNQESFENYLVNVIRGRVPDLEPYIFQNPILCVLYAKYSLGRRRVPEIEQVILQDPWSSYLYARDVILGRFEDGEDTIAKDASASFHYAKDVLEARFHKGEKTIFKNKHFKQLYKNLFDIKEI